MQVSIYRPYAMGIAAENKQLRSKELLVTPHEVFPYLDGELKSAPTPMEFTGVDSTGASYEGKVTSDNVVKATWLPESSNRMTAPDVRRGERIILYTIGDSDLYFWRPMGLDDHLRKLETVIVAISATKDEGQTSLTPENCYFIEMSSHSKQITLHTSKANGEPFGYDFQFDTGAGKVTLQDDAENYMFLDSANTHLKFHNADESYFELNKDKIYGDAPKSIKLRVGPTVLELTPSGTTLTTPKFAGKKA